MIPWQARWHTSRSMSFAATRSAATASRAYLERLNIDTRCGDTVAQLDRRLLQQLLHQKSYEKQRQHDCRLGSLPAMGGPRLRPRLHRHSVLHVKGSALSPCSPPTTPQTTPRRLWPACTTRGAGPGSCAKSKPSNMGHGDVDDACQIRSEIKHMLTAEQGLRTKIDLHGVRMHIYKHRCRCGHKQNNEDVRSTGQAGYSCMCACVTNKAISLACRRMYIFLIQRRRRQDLQHRTRELSPMLCSHVDGALSPRDGEIRSKAQVS